MQKRYSGIILLLFISVLAIVRTVEGGVVSPRNGGRFPRAVINLLEKNKELFVLEHRWADRKMLEGREGASGRQVLTYGSGANDAQRGVISGDLNIPVLMGLYSDSVYTVGTSADSVLLHRALFSGPTETGTMNDYYDEVSLGLLNVEGDVYGWVPLSGSEVYYTGGFENWGLNPVESRTGEFISHTVMGVDPYVDFGNYDNDGPDGIPNSGDDDGFVDILVIVTPTRGAECDWLTNHMWSHSARFSIWNEGGDPLATNDQSANGGSILIEDYIIGPTVSCNSDRLIEIGLFCHELGHMLGLPDLYDTGLGSGIGNWGIMGRGAVEHPESPAHPCAWSKQQLGWVDVIDVGWRERKIKLEPVALSGEVVRMNLPDARFKRRFCGQGENSYSLLCACGEGEAEVRGWPDGYGAGYGNGWKESMTKQFSLSNSSPCSLSYAVKADLEEGYDFGYTLLEAGGETDTLAVYTGRIFYPDEMIVLSDYLAEGQSDFTLRFLFLSDFNNSDEDGGYDSDGCRAFSIDNISVKGGGLDYYSDFENDAGGWRRDSLSSEYFLVSYRDRRGFDRYLPGEGLLVWHAENSIAYSELKNSGGVSNEQARGVVLEEADGDYDILSGDNYGDEFDPFPGATGSRSFTSETTPDSRSNGGFVTPVSIRDIKSGYRYIEAFFRAGSPEPVISMVTPDTVMKNDSNREFYLDISGENILPPTDCRLLAQTGYIEARHVNWLGEGRVIAEFNTDELYGGSWSLNILNGDGQSAVLNDAVTVSSIYSYAEIQIKSYFADIEWVVEGDTPFRALVYRMRTGYSDTVIVTPDTLFSDSGRFHFRDIELQPDRDYSYKIVSFSGSVSEPIVFPGPYRIEEMGLTLFQNYPNPFERSTTFQFFMPESGKAKILFFDALGRKVDSIAEKFYQAGYNRVVFEADPAVFTPGVYFSVLDASGKREAIKIVILR